MGKSGGWSMRLGVGQDVWMEYSFWEHEFCPACYTRANPLKTMLICGSHHSLVMDRHHRSGRKCDVTNTKSKKTTFHSSTVLFPSLKSFPRESESSTCANAACFSCLVYSHFCPTADRRGREYKNTNNRLEALLIFSGNLCTETSQSA